MKFLVIFVFTLTCCFFLNSALSIFKNNKLHGSSGRIINGNIARAGEFPWQVGIDVNTINGNEFCGGSLISSQWVLTAAHCVHLGRLFTLHLGSNKLSGHDSSKLVVTTANYVEHPHFNPMSLENDIGLIRLHMPLSFNEYLKPIELANFGQIASGVGAKVAGWGQTNDSVGGEVDELYYTELVVISNEECRTIYGDNLKSNMVCAVGNFNEGICIGDTGGALVTEEGNGFIQIAVATFMSGQGCEAVDPSGFTRVDFYKDWIFNVTGIPHTVTGADHVN